jgi:putative ABC transport system permease protein
MLALFIIAWRNLGRSRARSALTGGAILLGVFTSLLFGSFIQGFQNALVDETVRGRVGAIQVHRRGAFDLRESQPLALDLPQGGALEARLRQVPGVEAVTPRLVFPGLIGNGRSSTLVSGQGIEAASARAVLPLMDRDDDGRAVSAERPQGAVVGRELAAALGVKPGGSLVLQARTRIRRENALDLDVAGTSPQGGQRLVVVNLAFAQRLLRMEGRVTEYLLAVGDRRQIDAVAGRVRAALGPDYEVHTWLELRPGLAAILRVQRTMLLLISGLFLAVAVFGVVNTQLMNVLERRREIGTLMALGVKRRQIGALFVLEAALQALAGAVVGLGGALLLVGRAAGGLPLRMPGGGGLFTVVPSLTPSMVVAALGLCVAGALAGALYPALRAARLRPALALGAP